MFLGACATPSTDTTRGELWVWTDGDPSEWGSSPLASSDERGDVSGDAMVDLISVRSADDGRFLHFLLDVGRVVTAQGMRGSVEIALDVDGNEATGIPVADLEGTDVVIVLSRPAASAGAHGFGVGIRLARAGSMGGLESGNPYGLLVAPTHSSNRFEIRIRRGVEVAPGVRAGADAGSLVRGLVRYRLDQATLDEMPPFQHEVTTPLDGDDPTVPIDALRQAGGTVRVLVWNVSDGLFRRRPGGFQRVLRALEPDVVLLDEVYADVTPRALERFFFGIGPVGPRRWTWWLASGGGRQRTVVASPSFAVAGAPELERVDYEPGALDRWAREVGGSDAARAKAAYESEAGVSATGAWVDVPGGRVLFVPVDLQSGGYDGSPEDRLRELQATTLNRAISRARAGGPGAAIVIGGDLNLVGSDRPLRALRSSLDGDEDLRAAEVRNPGDRSLVTWRSTGNADDFTPGRLDFVLYSGSALEAAHGFVFDAADLSPEDRTRLGVRAEDTFETSDHLPLVVDFRIRGR